MVAAHSGSLGYAYALMERTGEGLPLLEQALGVFEKMNHQLGLSLFLVPLGTPMFWLTGSNRPAAWLGAP
jgi:hypothetical protein